MTKQEIIKAVYSFRGANREFSQEMGPIVESILALVDSISVSDITALTADQLDALQPGDVVAKKTGNQYHTYTVSYKGEGSGEGICLTYVAAGYMETVSYDRTESGWAYNSTDVVEVGGGGGGGTTPLVVKGGIAEDDGDLFFTPDANQPTFAEAVAAFDSGVPVILDINPNPDQTLPDGTYFRSVVIANESDYGGYKCLFFFTGGTLVPWPDSDSGSIN